MTDNDILYKLGALEKRISDLEKLSHERTELLREMRVAFTTVDDRIDKFLAEEDQ